MYLVKTFLRESAINGIGVFAGEDIPRGAIVWEFIEGVDRVFTPEQVENFLPHIRAFIEKHAYDHEGMMRLCVGNGQYTNHADNANTGEPDIVDPARDIQIAYRDIKAGEEITCNYWKFDRRAAEKIGLK